MASLANVVETILVATGSITLVASLTFFVEVMASLFARSSGAGVPTSRAGRVAVLVPAHNESTHLLPTLQDCARQLRPDDQLLVVADNCTDDTADVARLVGAHVIERNDLTRRGKGFALQYGIDHLALDPPDVVVMVDADCRVHEGALAELAAKVGAFARPIQALYLMLPPVGRARDAAFAAFTWRIKNQIRPTGLKVLGGPCQLMGTGMAFPFAAARRMDFATANIVEDLELGIRFAATGCAPLFCPTALVTSSFPTAADAKASQRGRWEFGHLALIVRNGVPAIAHGILRSNWSLVALGLDCCVPPLSILFAAAAAHLALAILLAGAGATGPLLAVAIVSNLLCAIALFACLRAQTGDVTVGSLWHSLPDFVRTKMRSYRGLLDTRSRTWVRTDRGPGDPAS